MELGGLDKTVKLFAYNTLNRELVCYPLLLGRIPLAQFREMNNNWYLDSANRIAATQP